MSSKDLPFISSSKEEYTRITFKPDLAKFGMTEMTEDMEQLLMKRVYDLAGTVPGIKVYLNNERIEIKSFKAYCKEYLKSEAKNDQDDTQLDTEMSLTEINDQNNDEDEDYSENHQNKKISNHSSKKEDDLGLIYERINDRWEVAYAASDGQFQQVKSFLSFQNLKFVVMT